MKLKLQTVDQNLRINVYNSEFQLLESNYLVDNNLHYVEIMVPMPDTVIIGLSGPANEGLTLTDMSLAGIPFNKEILNKIIEYKLTDELKKVFDTPSTTKVTHQFRTGYITINFFNPDPFAFHMYVGNKIKML